MDLIQFETFFIQKYLMQDGKLKGLVGASQILDWLTQEATVQHFFEKIGGQPSDIKFLRCAGGVFLVKITDKTLVSRFMGLWPFQVRDKAPGLQFGLARVTLEQETPCHYASALGSLREQLDRQKNAPAAQLPQISPLAQRYQLSGDAAIPRAQLKQLDLQNRYRNMPLSAAAARFYKASDQQGFHDLLPKGHDWRFPDCMSSVSEPDACPEERAFPFLSDSSGSPKEGEHDIAIIHADGNGMGQYIINFFKKLEKVSTSGEDYVRAYQGFSNALAMATRKAVTHAIEWAIEQAQVPEGRPVPLRPIVVGGDDVTVIVRADLALGFTRALLNHFARETESALDRDLKGNLRACFPERLTMTAGVAFIKSNQPFAMGYALSESLAAEAKARGRALQVDSQPAPALIGFHQVTQSLFEDAGVQLRQDNVVPNQDIAVGMTFWSAQPLQQSSKLHALDDLEVLYKAFESISSSESGRTATFSFIRKVIGTLFTDPTHARRMWKRWCALLDKNRKQQLETAWQQVTGITPLEAAIDTHVQTQTARSLPLADLLCLYRIKHVRGGER